VTVLRKETVLKAAGSRERTTGGHFYLVGLRYVAGTWQHMESFARCLRDRRYPVRFLMSESYRWMNQTFSDVSAYLPDTNRPLSMLSGGAVFLMERKRYFHSCFQAHPPAGILLVMWHPLNFWLARLVKSLYPGVPVMIWLHEPYKEDKGVYGLKALVFHLVELSQTLALRHIDVAIMHSSRGLRLFNQRYPNFPGLKKRVPLQFMDDGPGTPAQQRYISFLGRADQAKGIHLFFELVEIAAREGLGWEFQIVTPTDIRAYLERLSPGARKSLQVISRPQLTDGDLREGAAKSSVVMAMYKETMQSGVIPLAMMKGAPVVGTGIEGLTEWLQDRQTGVLVSPNPSLEEIIAAVSYAKSNFAEMTGPCRHYYLETFDDGNWERDYGWVQDFLS
jgi:glycosyltransferase involved in cell wall biosynthesis